jgi:hypothetical protein
MDYLEPYEEKRNLGLLISYLKENHKRSSGKVAFFIGAGVSKLAGYPLWKDLVEELMKDFMNSDKLIISVQKPLIEKLYKDEKLTEALQVMKQSDKILYQDKITSIFKKCEQNPNKNVKIFEVIANFAKYNVKLITTNIDMELENALKSKYKYFTDSDIGIVTLGNNLTDKVLYYLHGRIDLPESWVLTEDDYATFYYDSDKRHCDKFLEWLFKNIEVLVIIGFSLKDYEIRKKLLAKAKNIEIFWFYRNIEGEKSNLVDYLMGIADLNIKIIPYLEEDGNKSNLINLLEYIFNKAFNQ